MSATARIEAMKVSPGGRVLAVLLATLSGRIRYAADPPT